MCKLQLDKLDDFKFKVSNFRGVFRGVAETHFPPSISMETKMADFQVACQIVSNVSPVLSVFCCRFVNLVFPLMMIELSTFW